MCQMSTRQRVGEFQYIKLLTLCFVSGKLGAMESVSGVQDGGVLTKVCLVDILLVLFGPKANIFLFSSLLPLASRTFSCSPHFCHWQAGHIPVLLTFALFQAGK